MQNLSDDTALWHPLGSGFAMVTSANKTEIVNIASGSLRYIRWVATFTGTTATATFDLTGIARPG